jgi:nucleoside 2-deoxyribosyltransferase
VLGSPNLAAWEIIGDLPIAFARALMSNRNLRCFVASAFDRPDVDHVYDKVLRPLLRSLKISPDRVDRTEHNDDIDDKIIQLINACDICIADLTYARPSVYYEAGYAMGLGKPVIFTARNDHFVRDLRDDPAGNRCVHFDLQMKNIIGWPSADQAATFQKRLAARVKLVTKPILAKREVREKDHAEAAAFASASVSSRLESLKEKATAIVTQHGFAIKKGWQSHVGFAAERTKRDVVQSVRLTTANSLTKTLVVNRAGYWRGERYGLMAAMGRPKKYVDVMVFACLAKARLSTIANALPFLSQVRADCLGGTFSNPGKASGKTYYALIDAVTSETTFAARLNDLLADKLLGL